MNTQAPVSCGILAMSPRLTQLLYNPLTATSCSAQYTGVLFGVSLHR